MNPEPLRKVILAFARRYDFEEGHSFQDERLALRLFDETERLGLHKLGHRPERSEESPFDAATMLRGAQHDIRVTDCSLRDILSAAAILHDIGYVEGYEEHHKTARRLIMAEPIPGLSPRDQSLIAHIARYHRGGLPDPTKHRSFAALSTVDRVLVAQLGAVLRFADGLDRSHTDAVQDLRCELGDNRLIVMLLPGTDDEAERWAGQKKARWFEAVFGVQVILK